MSDHRNPQRNAADPQQVRNAARREQRRLERFGDSLRAVLKTPEGRAVLAELLERSGLWRTSWDPSARIHFNEGRRNFGLELLADIQNADEELYLVLERERRALVKQETAEAAAHNTPPAGG